MTDRPTAAPVDAGSDPSVTDHDDDATASPAAERSGSWLGRRRERRRHRISKWDRPPDPKDWRYFVGTLGKVLIATGILMFGFVAYQLWGTGIETARAQNRLESTFERAVATAAPDEPATTAPTVTEPPTTEPAADSPATSLPTATTVVDATAPPATTEPAPAVEDDSVVPGGVDLSDQAVDQDIPPIVPGEAIARLEIPEIGKELYVLPGVDPEDLKQGPGHYPDTPLPGQLGNAAIAGHRTTYGAPFFDVDQLGAGDELIVTMITGDRFVYEVTGVEVVAASDYWVVTTRDPDVAELTLTSCHPKYTARERIVVHSVLVPERSDRVGVAEFYDLGTTGGATIPGDDPTVTAEPAVEPGVTSSEPTTTTPDDGTVAVAPPATEPAATTTTVADDAVAPATTVAVDAVAEPVDAFGRGWFDDGDAWPQIALWGFALTIISLLAYQVSKRTRHDSIGFAVGILPFLFCLYFFFQNVNRLLPPGL